MKCALKNFAAAPHTEPAYASLLPSLASPVGTMTTRIIMEQLSEDLLELLYAALFLCIGRCHAADLGPGDVADER